MMFNHIPNLTGYGDGEDNQDSEIRLIVIVKMGEMEISTRPDVILTTYSLGSCLGVTVYDPEVQIGGMIHCMLPLSKADKQNGNTKPEMYVDTGVSKLLQNLFKKGAQRERLIIKVAGAATLLDEKGYFRIGERNHAVLRKILWKNNLLISAEDVGGSRPRTMSLEIASGRTWIRTGDKIKEL